MSELRIAIVGAGAIADSHIRAYLRLGARCRIVAIADLYPEKAHAKAAQHGLPVAIAGDHQDLLQRADFELASVCLPPFAHAPATVDLLRAGKHVVVEKPMATSVAECDAMLTAARAGRRVLSVIAQNRFKTPLARLKRVLESGLLGRLLHAQVDSYWWRGHNYYDLWWRGTWDKEGGGCTMNHAVHHLDLFHWLVGMPARVMAFAANLDHPNSEVEDFSTAVLSCPNGTVGQITASLVHHGEEQRLVFQGERAMVSVPWDVKASRPRENGFPEENAALAAEIRSFYERLPVLEAEGHDGQLANVVAAIEGREPVLVDGLEGRKTLELIAAIYQSAQAGAAVDLPLGPGAPFYSREGTLQHARRFHEKTRSVADFATQEITFGRDLGR